MIRLKRGASLIDKGDKVKRRAIFASGHICAAFKLRILGLIVFSLNIGIN